MQVPQRKDYLWVCDSSSAFLFFSRGSMPVFFLETSGVFDRFEFPCHMGSYLLSFRVDCRRTVLLHVQTMVSLPMLAIFIVQANDNTHDYTLGL